LKAELAALKGVAGTAESDAKAMLESKRLAEESLEQALKDAAESRSLCGQLLAEKKIAESSAEAVSADKSLLEAHLERISSEKLSAESKLETARDRFYKTLVSAENFLDKFSSKLETYFHPKIGFIFWRSREQLS
jgi:hypothetical protein